MSSYKAVRLTEGVHQIQLQFLHFGLESGNSSRLTSSGLGKSLNICSVLLAVSLKRIDIAEQLS